MATWVAFFPSYLQWMSLHDWWRSFVHFLPLLSPMSHISFFPVEAASFQLISKIPVEIFLDIFIVSEGSRPSKCPTDPSTILGLQNPSYDVSELRKIRRSPDREALKL